MNGTARWQLVVSVIGLAVFVMGASIGFFVKIGLMASDLEIARDKITALEARTHLMDSQIRANQINIAELKTSMIEVETQFCASDTIRNQARAQDQRTLAMVWNKTMGSTYPMESLYFPTIGRCRNGKGE